jgi:hypothetical protein
VTFEDLFDELVAELKKGKVYERSLRSNGKWQYHGMADGDAVHIDPRPAVLDTVFHELLHNMYPRWGEDRVERTAARLIRSMDEAAKVKWWRAYNRIKRKARPLDVPEGELK